MFQPNTGKDHEKAYLRAGPLALSHMLNPYLVKGYCIKFIKRLDEDLS